MSVVGYLGPLTQDLRLTAGDVQTPDVPGLSGEAKALNGGFRCRRRRLDPVLRARRLDRQG
jgi:hypothetical protein